MTDDFENAIEWLESQDMAAVTLHNQKLKKRILQLAKRHPDEVAIIARPNDRGQHGYLFAHIPVDWLKVVPPRQVTEKQRESGRAFVREYGKYQSERTENAQILHEDAEEV